MLSITATNINNQSINLNNNKLFKLISIDGLNPVKNSIKTNTTENIPGEIYSTSKDEKRTVTFQFEFDEGAKAGLNSLCSVFRKNQIVKIECDNYYINCYVESIDFDMYSEKVPTQIVCQCLYPYFKSNDRFNINFITNVTNKLKWPNYFYNSGQSFGELKANTIYTINNNSNIDCGCLIEISVLNNFQGVTIENATNNTSLTITPAEPLEKGFYLYLDLESDIKKFKAIDNNGNNYNILKYIDLNTNLLYLSPGNNNLIVSTQNIEEKSYIELSFNYLKDWVM